MKKKKSIELKKKKQEKKKAEKIKKKVATAMEWSHIEKIEDNCIYLKHENAVRYILGIKITPRNIYIDTNEVQKRIINNLRIAFNKMQFKIYWGFVFTPVDIDEHISMLLKEEQEEENILLKNMIRNDFDKAMWFQEEYRELEFCFFIKEKDIKKLNKNYDAMIAEINHAGFSVKQMCDADFYNYIAYLYENPMINDFYFSRGIFSCLIDDEKTGIEVGAEYTAEFDYDDYYNDEEENEDAE